MTKLTKITTMLILAAFVFTASAFAEEVKLLTSSHCGMCKDKIEKGLNKVDGVEKADLNLDTKVVTVSYDAKKTNTDALIQKVEKLGYTASLVSDDKKIENATGTTEVKDKHSKEMTNIDGKNMKGNCCKEMSKEECKTMKDKKCKDMSKEECKAMKDKCCKDMSKEECKTMKDNSMKDCSNECKHEKGKTSKPKTLKHHTEKNTK